MLRFILTYEDANHEKKIRFFKTYIEAEQIIAQLRSLKPGQYYNFHIKVVRPN